MLAGEPGPVEVLADSAYGSGEFRAHLVERGHTATIKAIPLKPAVVGGFSTDDFTIDTTAGTITCPNAITTRLSTRGNATFGAKCRGCPIRERCTTAIGGRHVAVNEHHDLLAAARAHALTTEFTTPYRQHRAQ